MTSSKTSLALVLTLSVLFGAGCISFNSSKSTQGALGVWKTVDGGKSWEKQAALPTPQGVGSISAFGISELIMDPSDKFALYAGTDQNGLLVSLDGGEGWQRVREPSLREGRVRAVAVDPKDKCNIYVSRAQRLSKSTDCGRTFNTESYVDTRGNVVITDVKIDWYNSNIVYLTTTDGDVIKSTDAGESWTTVYRVTSEIRDLLIDQSDSRVILLATAKKGLHRSVDGGASWTDVLKEGYDDLKDVRKLVRIVQDKNGQTTFALSGAGLLKSVDHGATWQSIPLLPTGNVKLTSLGVDPKDGKHIVLGAGATIYTTVDGGAKWDTEKMPAQALATNFVFDPTNGKVIYLGLQAIENEGAMF